MTGRIAAITGLFLSAVFASGCQNSPNLGQASLGAGMFGPHVATQQSQQGGDPFLNMEAPQRTATNTGHVRLAGMQQPQGQATSNVSPTIIQADYQRPVMPAGNPAPTMPAGYQQPSGPFAPAATMPASGWQSNQPPVYTNPY
jgi:hypothetical protein